MIWKIWPKIYIVFSQPRSHHVMYSTCLSFWTLGRDLFDFCRRPTMSQPFPSLFPCAHACSASRSCLFACCADTCLVSSAEAQITTRVENAPTLGVVSPHGYFGNGYHPGRNYYKIIPWNNYFCNIFVVIFLALSSWMQSVFVILSKLIASKNYFCKEVFL